MKSKTTAEKIIEFIKKNKNFSIFCDLNSYQMDLEKEQYIQVRGDELSFVGTGLCTYGQCFIVKIKSIRHLRSIIYNVTNIKI